MPQRVRAERKDAGLAAAARVYDQRGLVSNLCLKDNKVVSLRTNDYRWGTITGLLKYEMRNLRPFTLYWVTKIYDREKVSESHSKQDTSKIRYTVLRVG